MNAELVIALLLGLLGLRSLVHWIRLQVALERPSQHVLFALFVVCRVGAWWSLAGLFVVLGLRPAGVELATFVAPYRFLAAIPLVLIIASVALLAILAIGDASQGPSGEDDPPEA